MKNPIPQHIIDAAKADFNSPIVQDFIAQSCAEFGADPTSAPEMYPPAVDDVYHTLRNAHLYAQRGEPDRDPYPAPETSLAWVLLNEDQQAEAKALPTWQQREAVRCFARGW